MIEKRNDSLENKSVCLELNLSDSDTDIEQALHDLWTTSKYRKKRRYQKKKFVEKI